MKYLEHVTQEGERLDLLADRYYSDPARNIEGSLLLSIITDANPGLHPLPPVLPGGLLLKMPLLEDVDLFGGTFAFEPWAPSIQGLS